MIQVTIYTLEGDPADVKVAGTITLNDKKQIVISISDPEYKQLFKNILASNGYVKKLGIVTAKKHPEAWLRNLCMEWKGYTYATPAKDVKPPQESVRRSLNRLEPAEHQVGKRSSEKKRQRP